MRTQSINAVLAISGLMLGASGCIPVAYVYPKLDTVSAKIPAEREPVIKLVNNEAPSAEPSNVEAFSDDTPSDVTAFLVRRTSNNVPLVPSSERSISTIPIGKDGRVGKSRVTIEWNIMLYAALILGCEGKHDMSLMLFRPGFKTIGVSDSNEDVEWQPVSSYAEYEQSIDQIVLVGSNSELSSIRSPFDSDPEENSYNNRITGEREGLLRLAAEYSSLLELVLQNARKDPAPLADRSNVLVLQEEIRKLSAEQNPSESDRRILDWKREQLEFETRWSNPISRLELKIEWLEARARATSKPSLPFEIRP